MQVPVQWYSSPGRRRRGSVRGGVRHGTIWLLPQQQHHLSLERAQRGSRRHTSGVALMILDFQLFGDYCPFSRGLCSSQDELKKLYAQLEVYKCKKMLANNPHIQKKRSSKKGLGRTLMKRITEFPESMHRQSSREDSVEHDSNRSTLKRNPPELNPHGWCAVIYHL